MTVINNGFTLVDANSAASNRTFYIKSNFSLPTKN
jgi:hypothetical protein